MPRNMSDKMKKTVFLDMGLADYRSVWQKQEELMDGIKARKSKGETTSNYLLFVEHPHVYTLGKSGDSAHMLIDSIQLRAKQAEFVKVDRGGDITYHGPGQLVAYPILDMVNFGLGVKDYVDRLEEVVIQSIGEYGIRGERLAGATGVWLDAMGPKARKICAIGIKCSRFVTMHGFALNVNTDMNYFNYIHPCGFVDKGVTSMTRELGHKLVMGEVKDVVKRKFEELFGMEWE